MQELEDEIQVTSRHAGHCEDGRYPARQTLWGSNQNYLNITPRSFSLLFALADKDLTFVQMIFGGRNSSVGSAWARCPQCRGFDPPLGTFSVEGIFPLELTWVQIPFPPKLLRMRV